MIPRLLVLLALLAAAAFGASLGSSAHADTDGAAMSLRVDPADTTPCPPGKEPKGAEPMFCVESGSQFTLEVVADAAPTNVGYFYAGTWINYGDELGNQAAEGAVKTEIAAWPDCHPLQFVTTNTDQNSNLILDSWSGGCLTSLGNPAGNPSFHKGVLYEIDLTCDSNSTHNITQIPAGQAPAGIAGAQFNDIDNQATVPTLTNAEVNCVDPNAVGGVALSDELAPLAPASGGVSAWWFVAGGLALTSIAAGSAFAFARRTR